MTVQSSESAPAPEALSTRARSALRIIFVTLFLDLVGFSIIFPLFPAMLTYYVDKEGETGLIGQLVATLERVTEYAGGPGEFGVIVLFGGVLSSLYSLLQFVCAPLFGSFSDRYGRRPILLTCIAGLAVSYVLWFFAGTFVVLVIARLIGGIASANISTATAVVADVTSVRNRSRGMAIIGIAFGLGFIIGPALGGFSAMIDLSELRPSLAAYGVNPFSVPALIALALSTFNLAYVYMRLDETLPETPKAAERPQRTANPLELFRTSAYPGVTRTNMANFVFLLAFSGMEFSLTFLAMDRLGYGPRENAYFFLFIGITLVLVQGGYVRRYSPIIGPKRMSMQGLSMVAPGLVVVGFAHSTLVLYGGLFLMAVGSAQVIPCLTALASSYAPVDEQGRILGVFRSLGALARGVGPLIACVIYWQAGATIAYCAGGLAILAPLYLAMTLPSLGETTN